MRNEIRTAVYDSTLRIEACRFAGLGQPFPAHFHDYYVLGLVESGQRTLVWQQQTYCVAPGDLLIFHPGDNHGCTQCGQAPLDYRSLHLEKPAMLELTAAATGRRQLPHFSAPVIRDETAACYLRSVHGMLGASSDAMEKEETLLLLLSHLITNYSQPAASAPPACRAEVAHACAFLQQHLAERLDLAQVCQAVGLSKSTLLRAFTLEKGITPYRYLESLRIDAAKRLLEQGLTPVQAALQTGFSDQSHFTHYFRRFLGLSPGAYRDIFRSHQTGGFDHAP
ncbi:MAG: helix-turn-helix domain-containing protein [Clostridiales bacterium]|nr:helix-turn-helix domain-containing protein [Clostridiales bacterium]